MLNKKTDLAYAYEQSILPKSLRKECLHCWKIIFQKYIAAEKNAVFY